MTPFFRNGDYGRGLLSGATRVAQRIADGRNVNLDLAPMPQPQTRRRRQRQDPDRILGHPADHFPEHDRRRTRAPA